MPPCALDEKDDDQDAPDGAVDDEDSPEDGAKPPPAKKQRGTKCDQLTRQVTEMENKLHQEQEKVRLAEEKDSKVKRAMDALEKSRAKVVKFERALVELRGELQVAQKAAADKAAAEKKRLEKAAEKEEETRNMSEAGAMQLVTIRLKYQSRFDNTTDKADAIWAHIHDEFIQLVEKGDLPSTDGRSAQALQTRFNTELGEFRLWAATANRAVELSGVPADEVEEKVRAHWRPTTSLFRNSNYEQRPMSIPPFSINSDTAARGGMGNNLRRQSTTPLRQTLLGEARPSAGAAAFLNKVMHEMMQYMMASSGDESSPSCLATSARRRLYRVRCMNSNGCMMTST